MIDAFEAAAGQVKAETEGEQRIAGSYQVGVSAKPTLGSPLGMAAQVHHVCRQQRASCSEQYPQQ